MKLDGIDFDNTIQPSPSAGSFRTQDANSDRLFINVGTKDGFDNEKFKDYIFQHTDIKPDDISDVYLKDTFGFITLKKDKVEALKSIKEINGREIRIDQSNARPQQRSGFGGNRGGGFNRDRKPFDRNRGFSGGRGFSSGPRNFHKGGRTGGFSHGSGGFKREKKPFKSFDNFKF
ncbi:MAG: DbpA RNA binding domain-containing protein [Methanobrevibacter sp.]|jgi:hypothetical protein|nr:DbpA RNA binding domain-containing protein [Candidatus Methanovirga basalitermitum]